MNLNDALLIIHIAAGGIALLSGAIAAMAKKGRPLHIAAGKTFVYSMLISAISSLIISNIRPNPFLFGIGLFTLYLILSGWVVVMKIALDKKRFYGKLIGAFGILSAVYLYYQAFSTEHSNVLVLYIIFGSIMAAFAGADVLRKLDGKNLISRHGGRIGGAYIATSTAFIVVNNQFLPPLVAWLLPTVIGTPLIILALRQWANRSKKRKTA